MEEVMMKRSVKKYQDGGPVSKNIPQEQERYFIKKDAESGGGVDRRKYPQVPTMPPDPAAGDIVSSGNPAAKARDLLTGAKVPRYVEHAGVQEEGKEYKKGGTVKKYDKGGLIKKYQ